MQLSLTKNGNKRFKPNFHHMKNITIDIIAETIDDHHRNPNSYDRDHLVRQLNMHDKSRQVGLTAQD